MSFPRKPACVGADGGTAAEGTAFYAIASRAERAPLVSPLGSFPRTLNGWTVTRDVPLEKEIQDVLESRRHTEPGVRQPLPDRLCIPVHCVFSGRSGMARRRTLPRTACQVRAGSRWRPGGKTIDVPGWVGPIVTNRYVVEHGDDKSVVLYWYQTHNRIIASEYWAKFWLVGGFHSLPPQRHLSGEGRWLPVRRQQHRCRHGLGVQLIQAAFPAC